MQGLLQPDAASTRRLDLLRYVQSDSSVDAACVRYLPGQQTAERKRRKRRQYRRGRTGQEQVQFSGRQTNFSTRRLPSDCEVTYFIGTFGCLWHQAFAGCTGLDNTPIPSTVTSVVSPASKGPTPAGVPVAIKSPGSSVIIREIQRTINSTEKIMSDV